MKKTLALTALAWSMTVSAQTGLQGFDRNYPDTPAGDNPRGFTPQISPLQKPPPPLPAPTDNADAPSRASDPFTAPDPMMDGAPDQSSEPMDSDTAE